MLYWALLSRIGSNLSGRSAGIVATVFAMIARYDSTAAQ
jgi:hypothetical protein